MSSFDKTEEEIKKQPSKKGGINWIGLALFLVGLFFLKDLFLKPRTKIDRKTEQIKEEQTLKTPEEQIRNIVQKKLEGNNNMGWPYIEKIEVTKNANGTYNVEAIFNSEDNLTKDMIKTGVQIKTAEIMTPMFTERNDVQKVTVRALFPLQDKYGNATRGEVYVAELMSSEAKKVNWNIDVSTLALTILPKVYKVAYPNRIF